MQNRRPSSRQTRRGFLGAAAAAVGGLAAAPVVICSAPAHAAAGDLPVVNRPDHPAAAYPAGAARSAHPEPLNASVDCELTGRGV
ncbi:twin-arginine translocation signal domain-containing protein [Streptomyces aidingensis]|uniref:Tat (Twin-arginine translocation) pathway signal sequence n=1 Tax=Streptomyces aidingensis TaxID=910347 RepID=A0A1I1LBA0_9ACTN|nr:twin-arginine translocation signal domain-containing protein [Streptomyces aidingensis]SFC70301.1 Tat (twin-arginine translocation) pathway signal sequence [Streptomyces aidingensis]